MTNDTGGCGISGGDPIELEVDGDFGDGTSPNNYLMMIGAMQITLDSISSGFPNYFYFTSPSATDYENAVNPGTPFDPPFYESMTVANQYGYSNSTENGGSGYYFDESC